MKDIEEKLKMTSPEPFLVKALENFPGKEKDELSFKKGALITVFEVDTVNERYRGEVKVFHIKIF